MRQGGILYHLQSQCEENISSYLLAVVLFDSLLLTILLLIQINMEKYFWNRKEKRYEEMSGNLFLTLRAIAQKPIGIFMQNTNQCRRFIWTRTILLILCSDRRTSCKIAGTCSVLVVQLAILGYSNSTETKYNVREKKRSFFEYTG